MGDITPINRDDQAEVIELSAATAKLIREAMQERDAAATRYQIVVQVLLQAEFAHKGINIPPGLLKLSDDGASLLRQPAE